MAIITEELVQRAITEAAEGSHAVRNKAFEMDANGNWKPRRNSLIEYYSTGEAMICGILLGFWFEVYGSTDVILPERETENLTDSVWRGAWYFWRITCTLSNNHAWRALIMLYEAFTKPTNELGYELLEGGRNED